MSFIWDYKAHRILKIHLHKPREKGEKVIAQKLRLRLLPGLPLTRVMFKNNTLPALLFWGPVALQTFTDMWAIGSF